MNSDSEQWQREYYSKTSSVYDSFHLGSDPEHDFAIAALAGLLEFLKVESILDVGSGTGRAILYLKALMPKLRIIGLEPVKALREIGYQKGLAATELVDGDATDLHFDDGEFDLVCAFGVLHHISRHADAVAEMMRVARRAVFISDCNIYGQGALPLRMLKQCLHALGLWRAAFFLKTRGKGYIESELDGISYSYSVFDSFPLLRRGCKSLHTLATRNTGRNLYRTASHVAVLGIKDGPMLP